MIWRSLGKLSFHVCQEDDSSFIRNCGLRIFLKVWSNELPDIYLSVSRACHKCQNVLWLKSQPKDIAVASTRYLRTSQNFSTLKHEILIVIITFWSWLYPFQWQYQSQNISPALEQKLRVSSAIGKKLQHAPVSTCVYNNSLFMLCASRQSENF